MRLSWGEIRTRARQFAIDWADAAYEKGESQSFYNDFFGVFGVLRRQVATYERRVRLLNDRHGYIDLFWPGTLLVEQKSAGRNLQQAQAQALGYFDALPADQQPRYVLACDFQNFTLLDLETNSELNFTLSELHEHVEDFSFILGRQRSFRAQEGVSIEAAEMMGELHDALEESGYAGHDLERLLVRLLFCLFADDTGIFEPKDIFLNLLEEGTREDGSDLGRVLSELFDILDTPEDDRQQVSSEMLQFPYVNGGLFRGHVRTARFDAEMRNKLIEAARFNWTNVSPSIFGSLFQSVMNPEERHDRGAHYTTETNILKTIGPLFLDDLRAELEIIRGRRTARRALLVDFQRKLASLRILDPACGCGNFLVVAYREIRRLELAALELLHERTGNLDGTAVRQTELDTSVLSIVAVDQFYGIEIEEFPALIAEVAMWMTDHLANNELSLAFGQSYARIPLGESAHIANRDALEFDWNELLPARECTYVVGNPPFLGAKKQSPEQRAQVRRIVGLGGNGGTLDYVAAWFVKAAQYVCGQITKIAFVATNSITQGEQVAQLWPVLFGRCGLEISFAHRTFVWSSEARGRASVHVVIIGLVTRENEPPSKRLFSYNNGSSEPIETTHRALTAYLFDARTVRDRHLVVSETAQPISPRPVMTFGNMPNDDGNLILSREQRAEMIESYPAAAPLIRPLLGSRDSIDGNWRYCLWLVDADPQVVRSIPPIMERLHRNRLYRERSTRPATQRLASTPGLFGEIRHVEQPFVLVPRHSSERREYVPLGFHPANAIAHDSCNFVPNASLADFGILSSRMHMAWLDYIGGRIKSDYRYSIGLVYNTFPWPDVNAAARGRLSGLADAVLEARGAWPDATLADLYDNDAMPPNLRAAHAALDRAVDRLYRSDAFTSDRDRVEHLFGRYETLVNPIGRSAARVRRRSAA